jgi:hypothetical protein
MLPIIFKRAGVDELEIGRRQNAFRKIEAYKLSMDGSAETSIPVV